MAFAVVRRRSRASVAHARPNRTERHRGGSSRYHRLGTRQPGAVFKTACALLNEPSPPPTTRPQAELLKLALAWSRFGGMGASPWPVLAEPAM